MMKAIHQVTRDGERSKRRKRRNERSIVVDVTTAVTLSTNVTRARTNEGEDARGNVDDEETTVVLQVMMIEAIGADQKKKKDKHRLQRQS